MRVVRRLSSRQALLMLLFLAGWLWVLWSVVRS